MKIKIKKIIMFILTVIIRLFLLLVVVITFFVVKDIIKSRDTFKKTNLLHEGHIIYEDNVNWISTIYSTDLKTRKTEILYKSSKEPYFSDTEVANLKAKGVEGLLEARNFAENNKEKGIVNAITISKLDGDWILLGMDYYNGGYKIYKFNIKTKELIFLRNGYLPAYLPKHNKLIFFMPKRNDKGFFEDELYVVDMNNLDDSRFVSKVPSGSGMVTVSDSEIVFRSNINYETLIYNVETDEVKVLPFKNCYAPIEWRDKSKQLLCAEFKEGYFFTSLDGKNIENISKKIGATLREHIDMYIPEKDVFIIFREEIRSYLRKNWKDGLSIGILWDMLVCDVVSGKKEVLTRGISWPQGSAIYLPS